MPLKKEIFDRITEERKRFAEEERKRFAEEEKKSSLYDEILKCYEGETELHANTSFEFGLMNETYYTLFRDHDLLEHATSHNE